jgi:hypothetical protein
VENLINKEAFRKMMALVWGLPDSMIFHEVGENLFIRKFKTRKDLTRIWEGSLWMFDKNLLLLQPCDCLKQPNEMSLIHKVF